MKEHIEYSSIYLAFRHYLNDLHIYCRLVDLGFSRDTAKSIAVVLTININFKLRRVA